MHTLLSAKFCEQAISGHYLANFIDRAQTTLNIASGRVRAQYGQPCGLAILFTDE